MIIEKIVFGVLSIALFTIFFLKMIGKNNATYVYLLVVQFIGMLISFLELIFSIKLNAIIKLISYLLAIIIPIVIIIIEKIKKVQFPELFNFITAKICIKLNKSEIAKKYLEKIIEENEESYMTHKMIAQIYEEEGNYEWAIAEYTKVISINSRDYASTYILSKILSEHDKKNEAVDLLTDLVKIVPENYKAVDLLANIYMDQEKYKEAINVYMNALKFNATNYDIYYNLGIAYTMLNDFQKAKEFYEKAAELNSLLYNPNFSLGQIALLYGDLEEAEKYFMKNVQSEEKEAGPYYYLAQIAMLKGEEEKAVNYINLAIQMDYEIYEKIIKDPIFFAIKARIQPNLEKTKLEAKMNEKEKKAREHLKNTYILVGRLNNNDIKMMENMRKVSKEKDQRELN